MLKRKELSNLKHDDTRTLVGFSYDVVDKDRRESDPERLCFMADWVKGEQPGEWNMRVVLPRTRDADSQVYNFGYVMPREGLPVELIAATGLKYFQMYLKEEVQRKSNYDFVLGELLRDM